MSRPKDSELRVRGLGLGARFALTMTLALTVLLGVAGFVLHASLARIADNIQKRQIQAAVRLTAEDPHVEHRTDVMFEDAETGVQHTEVFYGDAAEERATLFQYQEKDERGKKTGPVFRLLMPEGTTRMGDKVLGLLVGILVAAVLVAAGVAFWVAGQVTQPIHRIVSMVRQLAKGDLTHRVRVRGGGEVELLARSIDRMAGELEAAQDAEVELSIREREMEVAAEVRESLLPLATPELSGFDVGAAHFASKKPGGDCHDFLQLPDGRLGLLVSDVSGQGVPAAVVGATARAYLRSELSRGGDLAEAFSRVNAELGRDVRRGMFVTALYLVLAPDRSDVRLVCAGHKVPLIRACADGKVRTVHPEGIALGFDKGPVFDRALKVQDVALEKGDRLVLANSGPLVVANSAGEELGEKRFYAIVLKHAQRGTPEFIRGVRRSLEKFAGEEPFPADISLVTVVREG